MLLAGCSEDTGGDAEAEGPDCGHQQSADLPHSGAPAVGDPIKDTSEFEDDICSVLPEDHWDRLPADISGGESEVDHDIGPTCRWETETGNEQFTTALLTTDGEGLSSSYANAQDDGAELFMELDPISGHPAIAVDLNDDREDGYCNVAVELRDVLSFYVGLSTFVPESSFYNDPCGAAHEIAAMAVETMKGAR
ncbi:Protein of unknown function [Haloechinothrix alba]|uniref:DUF3558 domain-containing protein n=2 Tax=Haloechinothrix alba TaxID=664784 RepID=A0A238WQT6_9PSEU|nr:Protein of unknown function [Haloechinothrix alba]